MRRVVIALAAVGFVAGALFWQWNRSNAPRTRFKTAQVERGDLAVAVAATGTIEPEEVIDVGAQVAGMIQSFGEDPNQPGKFIDYGAEVEQGTVLARIEDDVYQARVERAASLVAQAQAQIEQAKADCKRAEADELQAQARLRQAERDWRRAQQLAGTGSVSDAEYDLAKADFEIAEANLAVAQAAVEQAKANLVRNEKGLGAVEAELKEARQNLAYTTIRSPVKGVIIDRRVNVGQTVVASLNAPSLFLIAKDLRKLEVWASVNEADIGQIRPGQKVEFTVDAFPGEVFHGEVGQIRLNAAMTQNVVTYTVVVRTDNPNGKLIPYLTANLRFEVERADDVLLLPNQALRYRPKLDRVAPDARGEAAAILSSKPTDSGERWVWKQDGRFVRPVAVQTGTSDAARTEIRSGLEEGEEAIVGEVQIGDDDEIASPFAPRLFPSRPRQ
jgi:HlyD family secretion protein